MRAFRPTLRPSGTQGGDGGAFDQIKDFGAGEGIRTLDPNLGKVWGSLTKSLLLAIFFSPLLLIAHGVPKFT